MATSNSTPRQYSMSYSDFLDNVAESDSQNVNHSSELCCLETTEMKMQPANVQLFSISKPASANLIMIDRFGIEREIPNIAPYMNLPQTEVVVLYGMGSVKHLATVNTDMDLHKLTINVHELTEGDGWVYVPEIDAVVGDRAIITMQGIKHPKTVDELSMMQEKFINSNTTISPNSGFEFAINFNSALPEAMIHEFVYCAFPWMSEPIKVTCSTYHTLNDSDVSVKMISRNMVNGKLETVTHFNMGLPQFNETECSRINMICSDTSLHYPVFISPNKELVKKEVAIYLCNYNSNWVPKDTVETHIEQAIIKWKLEVEALKEHNKAESEKYQLALKKLKNELDVKENIINNFKAGNETHKLQHEKTKVYTDTQINSEKLQQEMLKTTQAETKVESEKWKHKTVIVTTVTSVVIGAITWYVTNLLGTSTE